MPVGRRSFPSAARTIIDPELSDHEPIAE
jgi:hypothetical protein